MANRWFSKLQTLLTGRIILWVEFRPNGSSAPTNIVKNGFSGVTRTGTGVFDCTLSDAYAALEGYSVTLMQNAAGKIVGELSAEQVSNTTTPKVTVRLVDKNAGAAADVAANANNRVSVKLCLRNTSVT